MSESEELEIKKVDKVPIKIFVIHFDINSRIVKGNLECCLKALNNLAGFYKVKSDLIIKTERDPKRIYRAAEIVLPEGDLENISKGGLEPLRLFCTTEKDEIVFTAEIKYLDTGERAQIYNKKGDIYHIRPSPRMSIECNLTSLFQTRPALS